MMSRLLALSFVLIHAISDDIRQATSVAEFQPGAKALCNAPICSSIKTFEDYESCMEESTTNCFGTLTLVISGQGKSDYFCTTNMATRTYVSFPNAPYLVSKYFLNQPKTSGSMRVDFQHYSDTGCLYFVNVADKSEYTESTCYQRQLSTGIARITLGVGATVVNVDTRSAYLLQSEYAGLQAAGPTAQCGGKIVAVNYDDMGYQVSVGNVPNGTLQRLMGLWGFFVVGIICGM
eukprot:Blabericola_migrator_1__7732@NODE_394_length_8993_cov_144_363433_g314_i0_p4_GENE_NODE_394_length_8993_cov_144_363433_g314_i0NODE_394_length_8993_cov_144_363433_g314_i0_p4_ORF_typecomplete_len234_score12_92_NODE_394_length_8993_cov_144_363433_g314_i027733474